MPFSTAWHVRAHTASQNKSYGRRKELAMEAQDDWDRLPAPVDVGARCPPHSGLAARRLEGSSTSTVGEPQLSLSSCLPLATVVP